MISQTLLSRPVDDTYQLKEGQWQIKDLVFGVGTVFPITSFPDISYGSVEDQDKKRPRSHGKFFGRDRRPAMVFTFEGSIYSSDLEGDLQWMSKWLKGYEEQVIPGATIPLKYCFERKQRQVFGRPRNFAPIPPATGGRSGRGWIDFMFEFHCIDDLFYSQERYHHNVPITQSSLGGLESPLVSPLVAVGYGKSTQSEFTSGGNTEAWIEAVVNGPIFKPEFELIDQRGGWHQTMPTVDLAYDQKAIINSEPWDRKVVNERGNTLAGGFDQQSRKLSEFWLPPGDHELVFRGIDQTGTSSIDLYWYNAFLNI